MIRGFSVRVITLVLAMGIWFPFAHYFFKPNLREYFETHEFSKLSRGMSERFVRLWKDRESLHWSLIQMRNLNPEWDFMARTFTVLGLANLAFESDEDEKKRLLVIIDHIIEDTLDKISSRGFDTFLMPYGQGQSQWVQKPVGSLFVDGEIALMLGARRLVDEHQKYKTIFSVYIKKSYHRMQSGKILCGESYPNECWLFCNTVSLAALRMSDVLDGTQYENFTNQWIKRAKKSLIDKETGALISTFDVKGFPSAAGPGPEGSSLWMAAHMLQVVDSEFAQSQYQNAKRLLADSFFGFGYSREWPKTQQGRVDIDSGPTFPILGASASASGQALIAARSFGDKKYFSRLMSSLKLAAFPTARDGEISFLASNLVGDAVIFYAFTQGPLWDIIKKQ